MDLVTGAFLKEKVKTVDFSELLQPVTCNCIKLWRHVSLEGQGHFLTLTQSQLHMKLQTGFSQIPLGQSKPNFICKLSGSRKWKFIDMMLVTWPKWLPRPDMVKTLQKSSSLEPVDRFPQNLICSIDDSCLSYFVQNDDPGLTLTCFMARSNLVT